MKKDKPPRRTANAEEAELGARQAGEDLSSSHEVSSQSVAAIVTHAVAREQFDAQENPEQAQKRVSTATLSGSKPSFDESEDMFVEVPPPDDIHLSWKKWLDYSKRYQAATRQVICIKETVSCKNRNAKITSSKAAQEGKDVVQVPMEWKFYKRTYICTHGWPDRDRGAGVRPKRHVRGVNCPFRFVIQLVQKEDQDEALADDEDRANDEGEGEDKHKVSWLLKVMDGGIYRHNHTLGTKVFRTYSQNRVIQSEAVKDEVKTMVRMNCRRSKIYEYLLEKGENVVQKDVDNLVQSVKAQNKQDISDDDACAVMLAEFSSIDGNTVTVDETSTGETGVMNLSSRHMRSMFARFPELILVDCTHKTNRYNYQLCTLMVVDDYGEGQPIQQSLLERNSDWHMSCVLEHLQRVNPDQAKKVEVIMVDKDLNEIRILRKYFPHAQILVCAFHVLKYLKMISRKPDYGKISPQDHEDLDAVVHNMVYARGEPAYSENRSSLEALCNRTGFQHFYLYFDKNWDTCQEMWVLFKRNALPHFQVHTNNHLESWFGHFKKIVKPSMTMKECVEAIIGCDRRSENDYLFRRNRVGKNINRNYDVEMNQVVRLTTHFVAEHVEKQYIKAAEKVKTFEYDTATAGYITVKAKHASYTLTLDSYDCTCAFARTMKLPCQHAIAFLKSSNAEVCIPLTRIHDRWVRGTENTPVRQQILFRPFVVSAAKQKPLSTREKYKGAPSALQVVCSELAEIRDDDEYREHLDFVVAQWRNVRQRKKIRLSEPDECKETHPAESLDIVEALRDSERAELYDGAQNINSSLVRRDGDVFEANAHGAERNQLVESTSQIRVTFTPNVAGNGRPKFDRELHNASEKQKRVLFNASEKHRRSLGEITLLELAHSIGEDEPGVIETWKRVEPLQIRFLSDASKKAKFSKLRKPVLNENAFYLLPEQLLKRCIDALPLANEENSPICVEKGPTEALDRVSNAKTSSGSVECVSIAKVGCFSRDQIEAMALLTDLRRASKEGIDFLRVA